MTNDTLYVGLDTDKRQIAVAVAEPQAPFELHYVGTIANDPVALQRALRRLSKRDGGDRRPLAVCYEAGPCGYGIHRQLNAMAGVSCQVVAPSLIPRRPGERVKTNRRDALSLARLLRAGELTAIWVPDAGHEAMRDLVRGRAAAVAAVKRCQQQIGSLLLRQGIPYTGKPWTKKHRAWLGRLSFEAPAQRLLFVELLVALDQAAAHRDRLSEHIRELVPGWSLAWLVEALQALRGYRLINAVSVAAEIGDPRRFDSPRQLMAFVGLVPSEHSTGRRQRRGGLTKTGNSRARKTLIEAAWTYSRPARGKAAAGYPPELQAIAEKARHRLSRRYRQLTAHGKLPQVAAAAIARESLGFIWAIARAAAPAQGRPKAQ
jgi:transposase